MSEPRNTFPKPIVPSFLQQQTIETLGIEEPVWVEPADDEVWDDRWGGVFYDSSDGQLKVRKSLEISPEDRKPSNLVGRVGLMACLVEIDGVLQRRLIADLRFVPAGSLPTEDAGDVPIDQEEMNYYFENLKDLETVDAFIAPVQGLKGDAPDRYEYYGSPETYSLLLDYLRGKSDAALKSCNKHKKSKKRKVATVKGSASGGDEGSGGDKKKTPAR